MLTSISTTATSFFKQNFEGLFGRSGLNQVLAQSAQHDLIAEQLGRLIIHHEDIDLFVCAHESC